MLCHLPGVWRPALAVAFAAVTTLCLARQVHATSSGESQGPNAPRGSGRLKASLVVDVQNLEKGKGKGKVCVALFARAEGFPNNPEAASKKSCVPAEGDSARVSFEGLSPGPYAVSAIHDENEDGTLNTGAFGIPRESFGFSRNPPVRMGAPGFEECAIEVHGATSASVQMHNL